MEGDDKIAILLRVERGLQSVVEHRVAHSGETTAALFHEVHCREGLGNHGIAGARAIVAATEFCQRQGRWWITGTGHDNAVGKNLDGDFATGVLVIAVCDGVDKGFTECAARVFIERDVVDTDDTSRVKRVFVQKFENLVNSLGQRGIDVDLSARSALALKEKTGSAVARKTTWKIGSFGPDTQ